MANETVVPVVPPVVAAAPVVPPVKPEAVKPEELEAALKAPVDKRKIKWGDQEKEVSFDEAVQLAQKAFGIENKAREHAKKAQDADAILEMLQKDPKGFAKQCKANGIDPQKLATEILYEQIRINSLSPEQRELEELKAKETERESEAKAKEDATKQAQMDQKTKEWGAKFEKDLMTVLAAKQIPMSRLTLALAAQYINAGLKQKKEYTVEQVVPFVIRDMKNIHMSTMGSLDGEDLLNYVGDDMSNKIAAARVARYKKGQTSAVPVKAAEKKGSLPESITKLKGKAYWKALRQQKSADGIGVFPGQE